MKKLLAIALSSIMLLSLFTVFSFADESKTFSIDYVNAYWVTNEGGEKDAGEAIYLFTPAAGSNLEEATTQKLEWWNVYVFQLNADNSRYEVTAFHPYGSGLFKGEVEIPEDGFIIAVHGNDSHAKIDESLKTEGTHITIDGFDVKTVEVHDTYGFVEENTITIGGETTKEDPKEEPKDKEMETIVVDGKFDDNGWASKGWKRVDSSSGKWQTALEEDETRDENFDFQIRSDDENIYLGFKVNVAPLATEDKFGNANGSNLRIWFQNADTDYVAYNYFIDFAYKTDGSIGILAKKNTNPDGNTGADFSEADIAKIVVKSTEGSNYWYVEAAIPMSVVGVDGDDGIKFFFTYSSPTGYNEEGAPEKNNALYFGKYGDGTEDDKLADAPYKNWDENAEVAVSFKDTALKEIETPDTDPEPTPPTGQGMVVYIVFAGIAILTILAFAIRKRKA